MPGKRTNIEDEAIKNLTHLRKEMEIAQTEKWFREITGRFIYEMYTRTLMNKTVVDRPVSLALNGIAVVIGEKPDETDDGSISENVANTPEDEKKKDDIKSIDPIDVMTNTMVDGAAVVRLGTGWKDLTVEKPEYIKILRTDGDGFITFLRLQYKVKVKGVKNGRWFRRDYFIKFRIDEAGNPIRDESMISYRQDWKKVDREGDFDSAEPLPKVEINFIPFVAFEWNKAHQSFLEPKKKAFLELERVSGEISGENVKHSRRKLFVKIPKNTDLKLEYLGDNVNLLTEKGDAFYPDPHSAVINGFFKERDDEVSFIENATGVVATEKIVALSGVSRLTAMKSIIDLAKKIRKIFLDGMMRIEELFQKHGFDERDMLILFPPLGMLVVDVNNQDALLEKAFNAGDITEHERKESRRMMLGL